MADLPTRALARGFRLAAVPAGFVGRRVIGLGKRVGGRPAEAIAAEVQARTAEQLFSVLGQLKGGAMKGGQWLSAMEAALPEQLAGPYGEALTKLQEAAPAMPIRTVHEVLIEQLGRQWRTRFAEFDDEPAAAASIGQVHRAVWRDGRQVAVKVQYPHAGEALATDLRQLDRLVPVLRVAVPGLDADDLFGELTTRILAEVDYEQEAAAQAEFARAFRDDQDFVVPGVVHGAPRVLVSEWVDGTSVAQIARHGSPSERDRAGLLLCRFLLSSPPRVGRLHGDPHPGNFRLLADGRLAVIDFGSTLATPAGWSPRLTAFLRAGRERAAEDLIRQARAAGVVRDSEVTDQALLDLVDPLLEPLRAEQFTFTRPWLRGLTTPFSDPRSAISRTQRRLHIPVRYLLVQRVAAGTTGVLCLLGASVPLAAEAAAWLPHFGRVED
ncbi:MAG TPA: AarF/ABC1/UbiB kinase family protein [Intrasporangium sp.]|uniref:ABC1 kinase family protein n=1 Tax=Intrasporangium sp. TaxID=1925024 RepID=UPI002B48405B|nr:AarF/ABC1/UbiB kinase family protein [Intrasporangium sp.]HKX67333.1 AarF/ABC1/UbiB kinase family protein [Intrasporangium sp.]